MDRFEYAVGLISLIVGLALADIAVSAHRLIKHRGQVKWDAFSVLAVALMAFQCVAMWYDTWFLRAYAAQMNIWFYLTILVELFLLFLAASAVLPDEGDDGWDLAAYQERQRPYLWTLASLFYASYAAHWVYFQLAAGLRHRVLVDVWMPAVPLVLSLALIWLRGRRLRTALVALLLLTQLASYARSAF